MGTREQTVLLISGDEELCARTRSELQLRERKLRIAIVRSVDAARIVMREETPAVIVLQEAAVRGNNHDGVPLPLDAVVSVLAGYAPVGVFGNDARPGDADGAVATGTPGHNGLSGAK